MKQPVKLVGFTLLGIGTLGLIIAEFVASWGCAATLTFAASNVLGLASLAFAHWGMKRSHK